MLFFECASCRGSLYGYLVNHNECLKEFKSPMSCKLLFMHLRSVEVCNPAGFPPWCIERSYIWIILEIDAYVLTWITLWKSELYAPHSMTGVIFLLHLNVYHKLKLNIRNFRENSIYIKILKKYNSSASCNMFNIYNVITISMLMAYQNLFYIAHTVNNW